MRICLEHKLTTCPDQLVCTVCRETFFVSKIRTLLYSDRRLLQGDICSVCLKLSAMGIRKKMREHANFLMQKPAACIVQTISCHDRALELLEASQEDVRFPNFLQWWFKKLEILSEEPQELEAAQLRARQRSHLQKILDDDQNEG